MVVVRVKNRPTYNFYASVATPGDDIKSTSCGQRTVSNQSAKLTQHTLQKGDYMQMAATATRSLSKIDVHAHFVTPRYRQECHETGHGSPDGMPSLPEWSLEAHLDLMKANNIAKTIMSVSSPGTTLVRNDIVRAQKLSRHCNEFASSLKAQYPEQFGFWASLPLPHVDETLSEISYALDHLAADGLGLLTNYGGTYLGHQSLLPVFEELNRRHAIVFIHPTRPCLRSGQSATPLDEFPIPLFEFLFDTARAVMNLFLSGTVARCPNVQFVIPHAGGALPPLIQRFSKLGAALRLPGVDPQMTHAWVKERINAQFYFDTAGFSLPEQLSGLLQHVSVNRILYGSDYPFTPAPVVAQLAQQHDEWVPQLLLLSDDEHDQQAVLKQNAEMLLKRKSGSSVPSGQ